MKALYTLTKAKILVHFLMWSSLLCGGHQLRTQGQERDLSQAPGLQNARIIDWNFESGRLQGWSKTGTAFDSQPTYGNNVGVRRPGTIINQQGNYWIGTYENRPTSRATLGATQGDVPTGTLTSMPFTVSLSSLSFLVGGGNNLNRLRVELLVKLSLDEQRSGLPILGIGQRVYFADGTYTVEAHVTGRNDEVMRRERFDLSRYLNRVARIRIIDEATGAWGHINVDDFQFTRDAPGDVWITGMEVTQVVQTYPVATVPLVGGKKTLVRVYVQSREDNRGPWRDVTARLTVRKGTINRIHTPVTVSPSLTIGVSPGGSDRARLSDAFNFLLDFDETLPGECELEVRIHPVSDRPETDLANNVRIERVTFGPVVNYWIYGATYSTYSATVPAANRAASPWSDFNYPRKYTENLLPVTSFHIRPFIGNPVPSFDRTIDNVHDTTALEWARNMLLHQPGASGRQVYILMPESSCSCGVEHGPVMFGHNLPGDAGGEIMAHEVGHFFGLKHVRTQPERAYPDSYPPYEDTYPYLNSWVGPAVGVRFSNLPPGTAFGLIPTGSADNVQRYDTMSYGQPAWISDFTYKKMMGSPSLMARVGPAFGQIGDEGLAQSVFPVVARQTRSRVSDPLFSVMKISFRVPVPDHPSESRTALRISGWIKPDGGAVFNPFVAAPMKEGENREAEGKQDGTYRLTLEDAEGRLLAERRFDPQQFFDCRRDAQRGQLSGAGAYPVGSYAPFSLSVPYESGASSIILRREEKIVAERKVSPNAPVVRLLSGKPTVWSGKQLILWEASDADGDSLTFAVEYSSDGGSSWVPLNVMLSRTSLEVDFSKVPGSENAALRVLAYDGVHTSAARLPGTFRIPRNPPDVTITADGMARDSNISLNAALRTQGEISSSEAQPIALSGSAFDWEDGPITETKAYVWSSDRVGALGTGPWIVLSKLSRGRHKITLTVNDRDNTSSSSSVFVTIGN